MAFLKKGNAICTATLEEKSERLKAAFGLTGKSKKPPSKAADEKIVIAVALPPITKMTSELRELSPPTGDKEKINGMLQSMEKATKEIEAKPEIILANLADPYREADTLAVKYGLQACGEF